MLSLIRLLLARALVGAALRRMRNSWLLWTAVLLGIAAHCSGTELKRLGILPSGERSFVLQSKSTSAL